MKTAAELMALYGIEVEEITDSTQFIGKHTGTFYKWWKLHAIDRLPLRQEFDITEHRQAAADIFVVEITADGTSISRLIGDNIANMTKSKSVGRPVGSAENIGDFGKAIELLHQETRKHKRCTKCTGDFGKINNRDWVKFESINCPVSRDGERVDFIMGVMEMIPGGAR